MYGDYCERIQILMWFARILACLALGCFVCGCSYAVGKITADPNMHGVAPKAAIRKDPRLAQKVIYEAKFRSVQNILAELTETTGVKFLAGSGASDWAVRSRKMNIFVKDVKLAELMDSIARTMKFRWSPSENLSPPTYRLVVDKKAAAAADAMMTRAWDAKEQIWQKRRDEWIDAIDKYGAMSDSELESLRKTNGVVYRYTRYGSVQALRALFAEVPEIKRRFEAGKSFRISADTLSAQTRSAQYAAGDGYWKYLQMSGQVGKPASGSLGYGDVLKPDERFDIAYIRMDEVGGFTPGMRWGGPGISAGYFHLMKGGQDLEMADLRAINETASQISCSFNNWLLDGLEPDMNEVNVLDAKASADQKKQEELLYPSEPLTEHKPFPELDRNVKLKIEPPDPKQSPAMATNSYIASFQKAFAEATGLGVVSDSWVSIEGEKLPDQEAKLSDMLNAFSEQFNYNWDKPSTIVEFRYRKWWKKRLNQISDDRVTAWSENTRKGGFLSLDDLAKISDLDYYQVEESLKPDKVLGVTGVYREILSGLDRHLHWLRLYSSLTPQMRDLLMGQGGLTGDGGINGHMLTAEQWKLAQNMFDRIGSDRSDAVFRLELIRDDKAVTYRFREIDTDSGEEDRTWTLTLPKYVAPPGQADTKK